jgi:hypothetical protein
LGYSLLFGQAGKGGSRAVDVPSTTDGVNLMGTTRVMQYLYAYYTPGGPVSGWWMRGEAGQYRDRFQPGEVMTFPDAPITAPAPFKLEGYAMSTGYMMSKSRWGECLSSGSRFDRQVLAPMEFLFRYESAQNLLYQDLTYPTRRMDVFRTTVWTAGINYYIKGSNAKIQANYNWVNEADKIDGLLDQRQAREVNNNNFVINFQLAW